MGTIEKQLGLTMARDLPAPPATRAPLLLRGLATVGITGPAMRYRNYRAQEWADEMQRWYLEAAKVDRLSRSWGKIGADPNDVWKVDNEKVRQRVIWLVANNQYGRRAHDVLVDSVVGASGIATQCEIEWSKDDEISRRRNQALEDRKKLWMEKSFLMGGELRDYQEGERLWLGTTATQGECLMYLRYMKHGDGSAPMVLELLEPDRLTSYRTNPSSGGEVINGIEYDKNGVKVAYHVEKGTYRYEVERIPAEFVLHRFRMDRPGQLRGMSWYTPVVSSLFMLQDVLEYKMIQMKIQNALAVIVSDAKNGGGGRTPMPSVPTPLGREKVESTTGTTKDFIQAGMIHHVGEGNVTTLTPTPSQDVDPMTKLILRGIAVGNGLSYERQSGDYKEVSFAGGRLTENAQKDKIDSVHGFHCRNFENWIHGHWIDTEFALGASVRPPANRDPYKVRFSLPKYRLGVNPLQEVKASLAAVEGALSSLREEKEKTGGDIDDTLRQIRREKDHGTALGMVLYKALFGEEGEG